MKTTTEEYILHLLAQLKAKDDDIELLKKGITKLAIENVFLEKKLARLKAEVAAALKATEV